MKHKLLFRMKRKKEGTLFTAPVVISIAVLVLIVASAALAKALAPYDPNQLNLAHSLEQPSLAHLLGTDKTGRDLFSRLLYGTQTTLLSALGVVLFSIVVGVPLGLISGYFGGIVDSAIMRVEDIILSFPALLLAFIFVASFGRGLSNAVLAVGIVYVPMLSRLTRSLTLSEKTKTYVEAAQSIGYSHARIMFLHILPNCVSTLIAQLTLDIGYAILDLASLSFLGLGVQPPTSDWGAMLADGQIFISTNPLLALAPGIMIIITVVALNILSDGVQMYIDPSQRRLPSFKEFRRMGGEANA